VNAVKESELCTRTGTTALREPERDGLCHHAKENQRPTETGPPLHTPDDGPADATTPSARGPEENATHPSEHDDARELEAESDLSDDPRAGVHARSIARPAHEEETRGT
jgi:hypothetical protein